MLVSIGDLTEDLDSNPAVSSLQIAANLGIADETRIKNLWHRMQYLIRIGLIREAYCARGNKRLYQLTSKGYRYLSDFKNQA